MARAVTTIQKTGPFFKNDPRKTFRANIRVMMAAMAEEGQADVKAQMYAGEGSRAPMRGMNPDRVADYVVGRTRALSGKPWMVTAVISVQNRGLSGAQGVTLMAAASRVESESHAFRRTKSRLGRSRKANGAELLKGIA